MLVLAAPAVDLHLGTADAGTDPKGSTTREAYDLLAEGFGPGFNGPLQIVVATDGDGAAKLDRTELKLVADRLQQTEGVVAVTPPVINPAGNTAIINAYPSTSPQSVRTQQLVQRVRTDVTPVVERDAPVQMHVGGTTAVFDDFAAFMIGKLPLFIGIVVLLSAVLLMAVFRSVLVPLKAIAMNLLSMAACLGVVVAIFQWGWLAEPLGVSATAPIAAFLPVMVFAIVFGLSMDYEVFLMSRIHEEWERSGDATGAVAEGLAETGRVITAAATIMVCVFGSFILADELTIKLFGVALAVAVFLDAVVIRTVLVPSIMEILGRRAWWLPSWLDRVLPRLNVEPPNLPTAQAEASSARSISRSSEV